ncbi:MAG: hypothetical protein M3020_27950 [Myxococcota bacterium]|nr:hypothetical protein [Myxococcota bacterium]
MLRTVIGGLVLVSGAALAFGCDDTMTIGEREAGGSGGEAGDAFEVGMVATGGVKTTGGAPSTGGAVAAGGATDTGEEFMGEAGHAGAPASPEVTCEGTGQRLFANAFATCLLSEDGTPVCWGSPTWTGQTPNEPLVSVSIGQDAACGLAPDCRVICWGPGPQSVPPAVLYARQVVVTEDVSCALGLDQRAQCWGQSFSDERYASYEFSALFQGESVCGILGANEADAGGALCWGSLPAALSPQPGPFVELGSADHACGLLENGELRCWGNTAYGATEAPSGEFQSVITGDSHFSCALDADGHATCWGSMYFEDEDPAVLEAPSDEFAALVAGTAHVCGLTTDGQARCWGYGVRSDERADVPYFGQASPPDGEFTELAAGYWHTCGLRSDGSVECWGAGEPADPVNGNGAHQGQSDPPEL